MEDQNCVEKYINLSVLFHVKLWQLGFVISWIIFTRWQVLAIWRGFHLLMWHHCWDNWTRCHLMLPWHVDITRISNNFKFKTKTKTVYYLRRRVWGLRHEGWEEFSWGVWMMPRWKALTARVADVASSHVDWVHIDTCSMAQIIVDIRWWMVPVNKNTNKKKKIKKKQILGCFLKLEYGKSKKKLIEKIKNKKRRN